jgi:hypothetical protein
MSSLMTIEAAVSSVNWALNAKPSFAKKIHRLLQISHRQIDKNLFGHALSLEIARTGNYVERELGKSTGR